MSYNHLSFPFYRLLPPHQDGVYIIDVVLYEEANVRDYYDFDENQTKMLAATTSRESAMAALKLFGATEYQDWTQKNAHWGMPLAKIHS